MKQKLTSFMVLFEDDVSESDRLLIYEFTWDMIDSVVKNNRAMKRSIWVRPQYTDYADEEITESANVIKWPKPDWRDNPPVDIS